MSEKPWSKMLRVHFEVYSNMAIDFVVVNDMGLCWDDIKKHYDEIDTKSIEYSDGTPAFSGIARRNEKGFRYIVVPIDCDIEIVAHECFHSVGQLLNDLGVNYQAGNPNESFAYPLGYLTKKCYDHLVKCQKEYAKKRVKNV